MIFIKNNLNFESILKFEKNGFRVERFRFSGLIGDPLEGKALPFTLEAIEKVKKAHRRVVVLTNGLALDDKSVLEKLLTVDSVHISLDAASPKTFAAIKRSNGDNFQKIIQNAVNFGAHPEVRNREVLFGIGFVVTQANAHEVEDAVKLAKDINCHFIRFKPDIRGMNAIAWSNWLNAKHKIKELRETSPDIDLIVNEIPLNTYRIPIKELCWAQYLFSTIGPDGKVYPCDHMTANGRDVVLGDLYERDFSEIWSNPGPNTELGNRCQECVMCPPFNWHLNRLVEELFILYKQYGWEKVESWVKDILN